MAHILIVDDTATEAALMANVVHSLGHSSETVADGETALSIAKAKKPNLILLDVVMPKVDGFNTCRKLKKDPETASIPVVMVTTKNQETDKFWAQRQGANGFVAKPFAPSDLASAIQQHVA
jgi:twitching motility two-component system response regulator PilH